MKAFLLAAGLGTRLRPLTNDTPKCMLPIDGKPLLDIWLDAFDRAGVSEVLVNLHYLSEAVRRHVEQRCQPPQVHTFYEPELLGSAGTMLANRAWVQDEDMFLAAYADNLTAFDLGKLVDEHKRGGSVATLAVFHADHPSACGIVETDASGLVVSFVEKPAHPVSNLANAGMYVFSPRVLDEIEGPGPKDIGYDLLPRLVGRARAVLVDGYIRDIGDVAAYRRAQEEWAERVAL
jgi:mannose-1-phosphate guanylyltransferase